MKMRFGRVARIVATVALVACAHPCPPVRAAEAYVPCRIQQRQRITFPLRLLNEGILRGEVLLMLDVNRGGELTDVLVFAYTRREFADVVLEAVKEWRFTPALVAGETVGSIITLNVQFEVTGVLAYVKPIGSTSPETAPGDGFIYQPREPAMLDRVPAAVSRVGPIYPREWIMEGRRGEVTVDFFIDETGRVRFPRAIGEPDQLLGAAAVAAVKEWRFEPPLHQRQPVLTRARQVFNFHPEPSARKSDGAEPPPLRGR